MMNFAIKLSLLLCIHKPKTLEGSVVNVTCSKDDVITLTDLPTTLTCLRFFASRAKLGFMSR